MTQCPEFPAWVRDGLLWKPLFLCWLRPRSVHKREPGLAQRSMGRDGQRAGAASRCPAHCTLLRLHIPLSAEPELSSESDPSAACTSGPGKTTPKIFPKSINQPLSVCLSCRLCVRHGVPALGFICSVPFMCLSLIIPPMIFIYFVFTFI